jgi:glycopeptide antibiotics resistance protein
MSQASLHRTISHIGPLQVAIIILAVATALVHLDRRYQRIIRWLLIAYTATTILAWFLITNASPNLLAYIDKPIEVALIILLLIEDRQTRLVRG